MKVIRVEKDEFELEDGSVFPIDPPLKEKLNPEEFQKHYEKALKFIQEITTFKKETNL